MTNGSHEEPHNNAEKAVLGSHWPISSVPVCFSSPLCFPKPNIVFGTRWFQEVHNNYPPRVSDQLEAIHFLIFQKCGNNLTATPFTMPCSLITTSPLSQSQGTLATSKTRCWPLMTTGCLPSGGRWPAEPGGNSEGEERPSCEITEGEKDPGLWQRPYLYLYMNWNCQGKDGF